MLSSLLDKSSGVRLELDAYQADYRTRANGLRDTVSWKLERRQTFRQPDSPSWAAFARGSWTEALRILDSNRQRLTEHFRDMADRGCAFRRVRVVDKPIAPYLHWELQSLHVREQCGENIRVISATAVRQFEERRQLPEIVTVGREAMYQILYDDRGILVGGIRFADDELVTSWIDYIRHLYDKGEPLADFFEREVADLAPPAGQP